MRVLVTGAAGMIGRKLTARLARDGAIGERAIHQVVLQDIVLPTPPAASFTAEAAVSDLTDAGAAARLVDHRPDVVFHLAAVLSGEAESDFDKGFRVNVEGTRNLFEAIRHVGEDYCPRVVFSSTIAVFGKPFPPTIGDDFLSAPLTSYGTEKAMCELMLSDYSRRGFLDGIGIRLPTICVRPGLPNKAASGFWSNVIREPINGQPAVLPVSESVRHWFASPRAAIEFLMRAADLDTQRLGDRRNLSMPGLSATVGEQIDSLRRVAGEKAVNLIRHEPDEAIQRIIAGWPERFEASRALDLGFRAESTFDEIIRIHIEDELGGRVP